MNRWFISRTTAEGIYIQRQIREKCLTSTIVSILLAGKCTWSQRELRCAAFKGLGVAPGVLPAG